MLEKIKYSLSSLKELRQTRTGYLAMLLAVTVAATTLLVFSVKTIKVFDGEKTYTVHSLNGNVASVLNNLDLKSNNYRILKTSVGQNSTHVEIAYTFPVYITSGTKTIEIEFAGGTVSDALEVAGITADKYDFIEPSADTVISDTTYIDYTDINYVNASYTEAVPYSVDTVYSKDALKGTSTYKEGTEGLNLVHYTEKTVNGVSAEKSVTNVTVLKNAVNAQKIIGTKVEIKKSVTTSATVNSISVLAPTTPIELDKNGVPVNYKSKKTVRATAYTYTGNNCSTGVAPKPGYIAVNPKIIPYGTKMYIKSADGKIIYGYAVAADTGGFIKNHPTGIDLFMNSESACSSFGVRNMDIYILS